MMKRLFLRERMWNWVFNDSPIFNEKRGSKTDSIRMILGTGTLSASKHQTIEQEAKAFMI